MQKELYFDISSEQKGGSLYRISRNGQPAFYYNHSTYDDNSDAIKIFETYYNSFEDFWRELGNQPEWFYMHPLFVHPEQRDFIRNELSKVNWGVHSNKKWQDSHQRQWKKYYLIPEIIIRRDNMLCLALN